MSNQRNNIITSNQINVYQNKPSHKAPNQKSSHHVSGRAIPSEINTRNIFSSNRQEPQSSNYSIKYQKGNQRHAPLNTSNQTENNYIKNIYVNQGKTNQDINQIKQIEVNKQKEKNGLSSHISLTESNSNAINVNRKRTNNNLREEKKDSKNIRERKMQVSNSNPNHNRAKSYMTERNPKNRLALPKPLKGKNMAHSAEIKRKTIIRGGKYKNIRITHIISTSKENLDKYTFNIIENLSRVELDRKPLDLSTIKLHIKRDDSAKSDYRSSIDGRNIAPISREKIFKTTIYQHAGGIGMTNLEPEMINSSIYKSGITQIPKKVTIKKQPIIQIIENFRSQLNNPIYSRNNNNIGSKNNTMEYSFNKTYNNFPYQRMNKSKASNNVVSRNDKGFQPTYSNTVNIIENARDTKFSNNVSRNNNISNYYNNIPSNTNQNYNTYNNNKMSIRKHNLINADPKTNHKDKSTSSYKDIQSSINTSPEVKSATGNNFYTRTAPKEDFNNNMTINPNKNNISPNTNYYDNKKEIDTNKGNESQINYSKRQTMEPSYKNNINIDKKINNQNFNQRTYNNKNNNIPQDYNSNSKNDQLENRKDFNNIQPRNEGIQKNPLRHINIIKSRNNNSNFNYNYTSPRENKNSRNYIKDNKKSSPKIKINHVEGVDSLNNRIKILDSKKDNDTIPINNKINQYYPPKININTRIGDSQSSSKTNIHTNTRYNTIQNWNDKNTKISPNKIYGTFQSSNDKTTNISPEKSNTNTNYGINKTSYDRDNKIYPSKDSINYMNNINQISSNINNKKAPPMIETNIDQNIKRTSNQKKEESNNYYKNIKPSNLFNKENENKMYTNKYNDNKTIKDKPNILSPSKDDKKERNDIQKINLNYISPSPKPEIKVTVKYEGISSKKSYKDNFVRPYTNTENNQSNNNTRSTRPTNIIEYKKPDNYYRPNTKLENNHNNCINPSNKIETSRTDNYTRPTTKIENKQKYNYTPPATKIENKLYDSKTRPTTKIDYKSSYNYSIPSTKIDNKRPDNNINPSIKIEYKSSDNSKTQTSNIDNKRPDNNIHPISKIYVKQSDNKNQQKTKIDYRQQVNYANNNRNNQPITKIEDIQKEKCCSPISKIENKQQNKYTYPINKIENKKQANNISRTSNIKDNQPVSYTSPNNKIEVRQPINYFQSTNKIGTKPIDNYENPTTKIETKPNNYVHPTKKVEIRPQVNYTIPTTKNENKQINYTCPNTKTENKQINYVPQNNKNEINQTNSYIHPTTKTEYKQLDNNFTRTTPKTENRHSENYIGPTAKIEYKRPDNNYTRPTTKIEHELPDYSNIYNQANINVNTNINQTKDVKPDNNSINKTYLDNLNIHPSSRMVSQPKRDIKNIPLHKNIINDKQVIKTPMTISNKVNDNFVDNKRNIIPPKTTSIPIPTRISEDKKKDNTDNIEYTPSNIINDDRPYPDSKINKSDELNKKESNEDKINNMRFDDLNEAKSEKALSITDTSVRSEGDINIDDLNYNKSDLEPIDNTSVFNNDEKLIDAVNQIEEDKNNIKKKLNNDEFNFMINGMLDDLLNNRDNQQLEKDDKERIDNATNTIKQLNKEDQIKAINALKNVADKDEKNKEIVKKLQKNIKKYWDTQKLIKNLLVKQKKEEQEENEQKEKEKEKVENNEKKKEEKIENVTLGLLGDLLTGDSEFISNNFYDNYKQYDNLKNLKSKEQNEEGNEKITFLDKEKIDKAAETLNNLDNHEQSQVIKKLRGRMKKPKEQLKLDKLISTLNTLNKMKQLSNKIKKKSIINKEEEKKDEEEINKNKEIEIEPLSEEELNELTEGFNSDLYKRKEEGEQPKTRTEKREAEQENEVKLKNVAKAINSLNKNDKKIALQRLKNNADDDKKKEQFNKLSNLINNTNNLKSYVKKLVNQKLNENKNNSIENKNNELDKNELKDLNKGITENLFPEEKDIKNETKIRDKHLNRINDEKIDKTVDIIKDLNPAQQKEILENLKTKATEGQNLEKFQKISKKLKNVKKMNNIINKLSDTKSKKDNELKEKKKLPEKEEEIQPLKEEEFIDLAGNIINYLYDENKYIPRNQVDKYLNKKEKEGNINKVADVINNLNDKDKTKMIQILDENADNNEKKEIFKCLNNKIKDKKQNKKVNEQIKKEIIMDNKLNDDIIKEFNHNNLNAEKEELNDDQLIELINKFIDDLFTENKNLEIDNKENEKNINKVANIIKDLNKNDQNKVISLLKENAKNNFQKENIEKVSNLVDNLNGIKLYLKGIIKKNIKREKDKDTKELEKEKLDELTQNMLTDLYKNEEEENKDINTNLEETPAKSVLKEEKLNKMADILNKLNENDKKKVLNTLEENAKNDKNRKNLNKLKNKMRKISQIKILVENIKIKKEKEEEEEKEKPKLTEDDINRIAYGFSADLYNTGKKPSTLFENLIITENENNKIEDIADTIKNLDKDAQDKALLIINNNAKNDEQKEKATKLSNLVKNINNMKSYFGKMIKSQIKKEEEEKELKEQAIGGDFQQEQIEKLTNCFWNDLNNKKNDIIKSINDIINNFANIIKELKQEDKDRALNLLKSKAQKENNNIQEINNLEKKINELNNMKREIESYKNSIINKEDKQDKGDQNENISKKENPEILIKELEPLKLQQLTGGFCAELNEEEKSNGEKPKDENRNLQKMNENELKINNIANIVSKLEENDQKKIMDNLDKNVKNNNSKKLIQKIGIINKIKNLSKKIKERKNKRKEEEKIQEDNIKALYENNKEENLPKEELDNIANIVINDIFDDKRKEIAKENGSNINKESINDIIKEGKIKNAAKILNNLNDKDKKDVLEKIKKFNLEKNEPKNDIYMNKLQKHLNNFNKMKIYSKRLKAKINKGIINEEKNKGKGNAKSENENKLCLSDENINEPKIVDCFMHNLFDEKLNENHTINEENIDRAAYEITNLNKENQDNIVNKLKEKSNLAEKKNRIQKLLNKIEKINKMKNLAKKVKEKNAIKKSQEEMNNEEKYGIIIPDNIEYNNEGIPQEEIIIKKPEVMKENDLSKLIGYFISDLYENEKDKKNDEKENPKKESPVEKYKKIKKMEKKMDDIAEIINNLDDNDKKIVLDKMEENAKNNEEKKRYKKLIHLITKGLNKLEKNKRIAKENAIKDIENQKKLIQKDNEITEEKEDINKLEMKEIEKVGEPKKRKSY